MVPAQRAVVRIRIPFDSSLNFFSGFIFTAAQVVYITAIINRVFISFSAFKLKIRSYIYSPS